MATQTELGRSARSVVFPDLTADSTPPTEPVWPHYEEVVLRAQGDMALVKKDGTPLLVLSFKTDKHPDSAVSSRGRRLFVTAPLGTVIKAQRADGSTWMNFFTTAGPIGEAPLMFNPGHPLYTVDDDIKLHFVGKDEDGATVGLESKQPLIVEPRPGNLNSKELLRVARLPVART